MSTLLIAIAVLQLLTNIGLLLHIILPKVDVNDMSTYELLPTNIL